MEYYLLNINRQKGKKRINCVDEWIKNKNIATIFWSHTIDEMTNFKVKNKKNNKPYAYTDANLFFDIPFRNEKIENSVIISIGNHMLYIYKQIGKLIETDEYKGFQIKILKEIEIKYVPLVLSTIKSNKYLGRGTFKKIDPKNGKSYFGNIMAIEYLLYGKKLLVKTFEDYLFCLSSLEFETLIAKIFEENGYFVPAYKGGYIKKF